MAFRMSILDISAAALVVIAILLPGRDSYVTAAYEKPQPSTLRKIAVAQARLVTAPGDGEAAEKLASALGDLGQLDWAARVGGATAAQATGGTAWRGYLAASIAHAERVDVTAAHHYAKLALDACKASAATCPDFRRVKLEVYFSQLDRGLVSGIDPREHPAAFQREISKVFPTVNLDPKTAPAKPAATPPPAAANNPG